MTMKRIIAGTTLAAMMALAAPAAPALADGAASTRNILLGIGAATYLIIQHNRKVHEKYAEYDRRQAELQAENSDAWAAYNSERNAYANATAEVSDLKREVSYQHDIITQQRRQLALAERSGYRAPSVAYTGERARSSSHASSHDVAMISYGWGDI
jgi:hypothetical protein